MKDYTKIIKENSTDFNDAESLIDFCDSYTSESKGVEDIEDDITEYADGLVPIYYYDITKEWTEKNANGKAIDCAGEYGNKDDIYKMMSEDLFYHYENELREDYNTLIDLLDNNE